MFNRISINDLFLVVFIFGLGFLIGDLYAISDFLDVFSNEPFFCSITDNAEVCNAKLDFQRSLKALESVM